MSIANHGRNPAVDCGAKHGLNLHGGLQSSPKYNARRWSVDR
jgi:hypothetical protein